MEGRLNGMMEEADKEKALKQVVEESLKEKTLELNAVEWWAATAKKVWELAKQKVKIFKASLARSKLSLLRWWALSLW